MGSYIHGETSSSAYQIVALVPTTVERTIMAAGAGGGINLGTAGTLAFRSSAITGMAGALPAINAASGQNTLLENSIIYGDANYGISTARQLVRRAGLRRREP